MKTKTAKGALIAAILGLGCVAMHGQSSEMQAPSPIVATIDAQQTAPPVSKYEFGMFIEHIGTLIYRSVWSEMLDDRKFYFPINSKTRAEARAGRRFSRHATAQVAPGRARRRVPRWTRISRLSAIKARASLSTLRRRTASAKPALPSSRARATLAAFICAAPRAPRSSGPDLGQRRKRSADGSR